MESANEAATQLKQLRGLLLGRNPPVKKRCYRHQTQNSHLFCDSQWKFSPSFPAVYVDRRDGHERDGHNGDFQKVQPAHGHRTDVQVRSLFFFFLGFCQANQRATLLITSITLLQTWTQPVRVGAAAVHMQRICLPGEGAIHCQNPTSETGGAQPLWYGTSRQ